MIRKALYNASDLPKSYISRPTVTLAVYNYIHGTAIIDTIKKHEQ